MLWFCQYLLLSLRQMSYSFPRRLKSQAISSSIAGLRQRLQACGRVMMGGHLQTTKPALLRFSSSFRTSSTFSEKGFPAKFSSCTLTFSFGLAGFLLPHTASTIFCRMAFRSPPPFFLIFSASFLASASLISVPWLLCVQMLHSRAVITEGSTPTFLPPSDLSAVLNQPNSAVALLAPT